MQASRTIYCCFVSLLVAFGCSGDPVAPSFTQVLPRVGNTYAYDLVVNGIIKDTRFDSVISVHDSAGEITGLVRFKTKQPNFLDTYVKCFANGDVLRFEWPFWYTLPFGTRTEKKMPTIDETYMNGSREERRVYKGVAIPLDETEEMVAGQPYKGFRVMTERISEYYEDKELKQRDTLRRLYCWSHQIGNFIYDTDTARMTGLVLKSFDLVEGK